MKTTPLIRFLLSTWGPVFHGIAPVVAVFLMTAGWFVGSAGAADLKVLKTGLGSGTVASSPAGISCGADCDETFGSAVAVTLTATAGPGSTFLRWDGDPDVVPTAVPDCTGTSNTCTVSMSVDRSVRPVFDLSPAIPPLGSFTPEDIQTYLTANPTVNSTARFVNALPSEFKQNWILMSRSESLQTGTAEFPRILLPSANAQFVFSLGLAAHSSYPGSHPKAIEFMQWDPGERNFRFHEIVLDSIPIMGVVPARSRGVSIDDDKCSKCHSTQNVLNRGISPGTEPGIIKVKNKPNWDAYDSWGGMMPFNRDRIYQGSLEAAAFRKLFNPWTWRSNDTVRSIIEQLELQPPSVPAAHVITRTSGGTNDGHVDFAFDASPPVLTEPVPTGSAPAITTNYSFNGVAGTGAATSVTRGGSFVTLHNSDIPTSDEGRGVRFFDALGGLGPVGTRFNQKRIADELIGHRFATGSFRIDVRPTALAITKGCISVNDTTDPVTITPSLAIDFGFFDARNGMSFDGILKDTMTRATPTTPETRSPSLPRRKADVQKRNLDRSGDVYLVDPTNGLIQQYGAATSAGTDTSMSRLRQEVFRRPISPFPGDSSVMGGIYVDRESYGYNTNRVALYRYFLEPLGVSVDKWSMGVRGRSRSYTFADVFSTYANVFTPELEANLTSRPVTGLSAPFACADLITAVNSTLSSLPAVDAVPTYTDVQRIFNRSCIECHGGLDYPPYGNYGSFLNISEDENPPAGDDRLDRSHDIAVAFVNTDPATSFLYQRITATGENCPFGLMPCGGPPLSKVDIETIRRWIVGGAPNTRGDPHIKTIDGVNYDFQAAGEYVLLRGQGLEVQARQTAVETTTPLGPNAHTGLTSCVSVNSAVAVRVGKHRITYQPNLSGEPDPDGLQLRVDGKLRQMSAAGIPLATGGRIIQSTAPGGIQIEAPGGTVVIITPGWWNHYQMWYLNIDARHVRATQGVMGAIAPGNWLPALPDGSLLGPRPVDLQQRYDDLYGKFGNAWRVSDASTLFDYAPGISTNAFTIASWPSGEAPNSCDLPPRSAGTPTKPPLAALTLEVAEQHCSAIIANDARHNCTQDVMVTAEPGFAKTYLLAEKIERNKIPTAPVLDFPERFEIDLAAPIAFTWDKTTDLDGDTITYRHCVWPVGERFNSNECDTVSTQTTMWDGGIYYAFWVILLGCLLFAVLVFLGMRRKPGLLILVAIAILAVAVLAYYFGARGTVSKTVTSVVSELESGKAYYWKVIAEDGKGGTVESETRRFEIK